MLLVQVGCGSKPPAQEVVLEPLLVTGSRDWKEYADAVRAEENERAWKLLAYFKAIDEQEQLRQAEAVTILSVPKYNYLPSESAELFRRGFLDAGGDPSIADHLIYDVVPCEYGGGNFEHGWRPYEKVNDYDSRLQFHPVSWLRAGGGDPANDYQVGHNAAVWIGLIKLSGPGSTSGWPVCWWRGI